MGEINRLQIKLLIILFIWCLTANIVANPVDSISRLLPTLKGEVRLDAYLNICNYLSGTGDHDPHSELDFIRAYRKEACKQKNIEREGEALSLQIYAYNSYNMVDSLEYYLPGHLDFMKKHKLWQLYYSCWSIRVERYLWDIKLQTALYEAKKMYFSAEENKVDYGMGISAYLLGSCSYSIGQYHKAVTYCLEAERYLKKEKAIGALLNLYYTSFQAFEKVEKYDEQLALTNRWQSLLDDYCRQKGLTPNDLNLYYSYCYISRANALMGKGELDAAGIYLAKIEEYARGEKAYPRLMLLKAKSRYEELCGNYKNALDLVQERYSLLDTVNNFPGSLGSLEQKAGLLLKLKRGEESARLFRKLLHWQDSLNSKSMFSQLDELTTIYRVTERLNEERNTFRLWMVVAVGGCFFLILLLCGYGYYHYRLQKKNRSLYLRIQEQELLKEENRKTRNRIPVEELSKEMQLFLQLEKLMFEQRLYTNTELKRKELADMLGTNESYLVNAIHEGANKSTFREYLLELRLKQAVYLLTEQVQMPIESIGEESGFSSRSTFFRVFRDRFGMSPNEYRKVSNKKK